MITKKLELDDKLWLPVLPAEVILQIFGRFLENPTWTMLARASMVCKGWQEKIRKEYSDFPELSSILSRQILHVHPMMNFWLKIVGDCRMYTRWFKIPDSDLMSRVVIQKSIAELAKPSAQIYTILRDVEYNKEDKFFNLVRKLPELTGDYRASKKDESYLLKPKAICYLEKDDCKPFVQRLVLYNKVNHAIKGGFECAIPCALIPLALCLPISFVSYGIAFDPGPAANPRQFFLFGNCFALLGAQLFATLMWLCDELGNRSMMGLSSLFCLSPAALVYHYFRK